MDGDYKNGPTLLRDGILPPLHVKRPGHDAHLQRQHLQRMQDTLSDSDENESELENLGNDENDEILDLDPAYAKTVALWSFLKFNSIAIFPPGGTEIINYIFEYAETHLGYRKFEHKLMLLSPGQLTPVDLKNMFQIRSGCVVMVMPGDHANLTIEISQLKTSFTLTVDLTTSVEKVKTYIQRRKGIPVERQEILFSNKPLENDRRLIEYRVKSRSTLYVMIQAHFDLLINVETFWGKTYRFYLDPCSTGMDIVYAVFNRAFSANSPDDAGLHVLYVPIHVLVLQYQNKFVNWDYCIAYLGIHTGESLILTTVGHQSSMKIETVNVVTETGENYAVTVSQYDRWSVLAFMLHGLTNVPVDLIRLYRNGKGVDFSSTIGQLENNHVVLMNVVMTHIDKDLVFGVPLKINIGNGIIENVRVTPNKSIRSLKRKLEKMGVPNATLYELTIGNQKLPNHGKITDFILDLKIPLVLKLETYPVFAHAPDGVIYKTFLKANQTIASFKQKIELKTGYSLKQSRLIIAGKELQVNTQSVLYEVGVSCRNSIFFLPAHDYEPLFILGNNWVEKIKIPTKPSTIDIRNAVWNSRKLSEGSLNCVLTIIYWFFLPKLSKSNKSNTRTKIKKRMPVAREVLYDTKRLDKIPITEKDLIGKHKAGAPHSSPLPYTERDFQSWQRASDKIRQPLKNYSQFEPDQYIDQKHILVSRDRELQQYPVKFPQIYDSPRSITASWMKNLQARNKMNRLTTSDAEGGPDGMASIRQSRTKLFQKNIDKRMTEMAHIPNNPDLPLSTYIEEPTENFSTHKRFMYNHQHFDFVSSEPGDGEQSEATHPQKFLPKI